MTVIQGDVFAQAEATAQREQHTVLLHQVNCQGVMGAGVALAVKERYPEVFTAYRDLYLTESDFLLARGQLVSTHHDDLWVGNVFGQHGYGTGRRQTSYDAVYTALSEIKRESARLDDPVFILPYKMGCDRGGGDWNIYSAILTATLGSHWIAVDRV